MTGLIILAAGQSARMGQPKQHLLYKGKTLLQHTIDVATASVCSPVIGVLGAYADDIIAGIQQGLITIVYNPNWAEGMASSIKTGITELQKTDGINAAVIMLCDQPFVNTGLINKLVKQHQQSGKGIIACSYSQTVGVPAVFSRQYFATLQNMQGRQGAKQLCSKFTHDLSVIDFPSGATDIDIPDDYQKLL